MKRFQSRVLAILIVTTAPGCSHLSQQVYDAEQAGRLREGMSQAELESIVGRGPDDRNDAVLRTGDVVEWTPLMQHTGGHGRLYTFRLRDGIVERISVRDDGNSWLQIQKK